MQIKLTYMGSYETEFKGKTYRIDQFLDPNSLLVLNGSNLKTEKPFIQYEVYNCIIELKSNKLKVVKVV